jgi:hypothetical protein
MGLLHPTAKTGATGFGISVLPSFPNRDSWDTDTLKHTETGATEIWKPVPPGFDRQSRLEHSFESTPLSPFVINHQ